MEPCCLPVPEPPLADSFVLRRIGAPPVEELDPTLPDGIRCCWWPEVGYMKVCRRWAILGSSWFCCGGAAPCRSPPAASRLTPPPRSTRFCLFFRVCFVLLPLDRYLLRRSKSGIRPPGAAFARSRSIRSDGWRSGGSLVFNLRRTLSACHVQ